MNTVRPLFVSTYPPEACGLATFTRDSADAVDIAAPEPISSVAAIQKTSGLRYDDPRVVHVIDNSRPDAYRMAAEVANDGPCDVVSLQHEFGLYPGEWGVRMSGLCPQLPQAHRHHVPHALDRARPASTADHPKSGGPQPRHRGDDQGCRTAAGERVRRVGILRAGDSSWSAGGSLSARRHPQDSAGTRGPAGDLHFRTDQSRQGTGIHDSGHASGRRRFPEAIYLIVGATHPQVKLHEGEVYRESLVEMAESLGVGQHVRFVNKYLSLADLLVHLQACDVYVTPYPGKDQISSGALAYALAAGGAVVSTPYLYAEEVLANGRGLLVPFGQSDAMADATLRFLSDTAFQVETRRKAYQYAKPMFWPNVGRQYLEFFDEIASENETSRRRLDRRASSTSKGERRPTELLHAGM